jgi:[CysO sulfur-carrier protein]-S-L-cysteine hydrolase
VKATWDVKGSGRLVDDRFATLRPMLALPNRAFAELIGHAYDGYPLEACGLLIGRGDQVERFVACANEAASARIYTIPPKELLLAERQAENDGLDIIGVFHSHTHSEPYPSPTDVDQAPDPGWHYVIVSLKREAPETRSYRIADGVISEERVAVV